MNDFLSLKIDYRAKHVFRFAFLIYIRKRNNHKV